MVVGGWWLVVGSGTVAEPIIGIEAQAAWARRRLCRASRPRLHWIGGRPETGADRPGSQLIVIPALGNSPVVGRW